jgi:DNA-binding IclR family transcriptional regulator
MQKYTVPSLARAFEILDMLALSSVGLTKMEIARKIGIPYSTAFNLLNTMADHGYVRKDEAGGRYYLGLKLLSLGSAQLKDANLRDSAAVVLEQLVRQTGMTAHLAILDRGEAIYIDKKEPDGFVKINSWVGKRNFIHTSAVGKALVAWLDEEEARRLWDQGLPKRTSHTITSWKKLKADLIETRERGYATDREEDELGGRCVAAPIFDAAGLVVASVGVSGIVSQVPDERFAVLGEMLRGAAQEISRRLGHVALPEARPETAKVAARKPRK